MFAAVHGCVCVRVRRVGGCLCGMEGCKNGGMDDTNRAEWWEAGVMALLPLPGWMQYLTAD